MEEIWKIIDGSDNKYKISSFGRVWNNLKNEECKYYINKCGYYNCSVLYKNKRQNIGVHRLVGLHFIPNPDNKPTVNHKIADKSNNKVDNLEWATRKEQMIHVKENNLYPTSRPCCIIDDNNNIINIYYSYTDAMKLNNFSTMRDIRKSCIGKINSSLGLKFRHYDSSLKTYIPTDFDKGLIKPKGQYKKKIYCQSNGKTYNTQAECAKDLGIKQIEVSNILKGYKENKYFLKNI